MRHSTNHYILTALAIFNRAKRQRTTVRQHLKFESLEDRTVFSATPLTSTISVTNPITAAAVESINGTGNNLANTLWGSAGTDLLRIAAAAYADGISAPVSAGLPSARAISNAVVSQAEDVDILNNLVLSAFIYAWGQFIDHDMDLTPGGSTPFNVAVPSGDPSFDPAGTGTAVIPLNRSITDAATGTSTANPAQQVNTITAFLDGSMIYGS